MLFAVVYAWLRLILDLADVRLRLHNPEAELLLLRHQLRVVSRQVKRPRLNPADRTIMAAEPESEPCNSGRHVGPAGDSSGLASRAGEKKVGSFWSPSQPRAAMPRSRASEAASAYGQGQPDVGRCASP